MILKCSKCANTKNRLFLCQTRPLPRHFFFFFFFFLTAEITIRPLSKTGVHTLAMEGLMCVNLKIFLKMYKLHIVPVYPQLCKKKEVTIELYSIIYNFQLSFYV